MSAQVGHPPGPSRRVSSPEIQITGQVVAAREVITIDDSDDDVQAVPPIRGQPDRPREDERQRRSTPGDRHARFIRMRRIEQGGAMVERDLLQEAFDRGDLDFASLSDDEDDSDYMPGEDEDRIFSPTPPPHNGGPNARRIGLGGALFVRDGMQINIDLGERVQRYLQHLPYLGFAGHRDLLAQVAPPAIPPYNPSFTHPDPKPGFTHSFPASPHSPDRKGKSVGSSASINFQCTNCHENLYLAAPDAKHRVYALRCGHLLDGQCVTKLSTPPPDLFPQTLNIPVLGVEANARRGRGRNTRSAGRGKPKARGRKRKRDEEKLVWEWPCPACKRPHVSEWDPSGGENQNGAWIPNQEDGAILLYL